MIVEKALPKELLEKIDLIGKLLDQDFDLALEEFLSKPSRRNASKVDKFSDHFNQYIDAITAIIRYKKNFTALEKRFNVFLDIGNSKYFNKKIIGLALDIHSEYAKLLDCHKASQLKHIIVATEENSEPSLTFFSLNKENSSAKNVSENYSLLLYSN